MKPVSKLERYALAFLFPIYIIIVLNLGPWYVTLDPFSQGLVGFLTFVPLFALRFWDWNIIKRDVEKWQKDNA